MGSKNSKKTKSVKNVKSVKSVKTDKNEINVYYKGIKQTVKYYGKFNEKSIKTSVKQIYKINEPLEQIYFQDEDGDILALNDQTPSGISVHIYVEPDAVPKNPSTDLKIPETSEKLLKFHWLVEYDIRFRGNTNLNVIEDKYTYRAVNGYEIHPAAISSCSFEKGKHFFVLRKPFLSAYTALAITNFENKSTYSNRQYSIGIFDGYPDEHYSTFSKNLGIYIDMDNKKCIFYDYDKRTKNKIKSYVDNSEVEDVYEAPILCKKVKLFAWIKRGECCSGRITILNEGCIPIPDWIKI